MRRFSYDDEEPINNFFDNNDDDDDDDDDDFDEDYNLDALEDFTSEEYLIVQQQALQEQQIALDGRGLNLNLLKLAIKIAEKAFFWKFYSLDTKLKMISKSYKVLEKIFGKPKEDKKESK